MKMELELNDEKMELIIEHKTINAVVKKKQFESKNIGKFFLNVDTNSKKIIYGGKSFKKLRN